MFAVALYIIFLSHVTETIVTGMIDYSEPSFYPMFYGLGFFARFVNLFALGLFAMMIGWLMKVIYDILSKNWRYVAMVAGSAVILIIILLNMLVFEGFVGTALGWILRTPWFAAMWYMVFAAVFAVATWLITRRTQVA